MTKTTEELKREMYVDLKRLGSTSGIHLYKTFEESLEAYLEALRQEADTLIVRLKGENERNVILLDAYRNQQTLTSEARTEADRERNRAQAFEFANKSAGEFLQAAQAKVKSQRQSIGQLKNDRNNAQALAAVNYQKYQKARKELSELRKSLMATPAQDSTWNGPESIAWAAAANERKTVDIDCKESKENCRHKMIGRLIFNNHTQLVCLSCNETMIKVM